MLTVGDIKRAVKGALIQGDASAALDGVSIDSRTVKKNSLFIAIKGEKFDGHKFIDTAVRKGAKAVVVSKKVKCPSEIPVIFVPDTTRALGLIAQMHRGRFNIPVVAITGSTGKTTTKEMIAAVLGKQLKVLKNVKTENNQFGVPLTLLRLNASHRAVVLELGTSRPGDICWLAQISRPTVAVFTNIGNSHLQGLKSPQGVFREKKQLIKYVNPKGTVILNNDDWYLKTISQSGCSQKMIRYGLKEGADFTADHIIVQNNCQLHFVQGGQPFKLNSPAVHNIYNALAAISCGLAVKIRYNNIAAALSRLSFRDSRLEVLKIRRYWVIDDTYNANPVSFESAINTLNMFKISGKRIVVCADMLELGKRSKGLHQELGEQIARSSVDIVLTVGDQARFITEKLKKIGARVQAWHCRDLNCVHQRLKKICRPGDAVLVKGSRGMRMERTVAFLKLNIHQFV